MPERAVPRPFPAFPLEEALAIADAIQDKNAGRPMNRLLIAESIGRKPGSSDYRDLLSASFKYGLTAGTEKARDVELTSLGVRATRPMSPEDKRAALQEAALAPEALGAIYRHYDNAKLPSGTFFQNVLERQFQIPRQHVAECETLLVTNGRFAGILRDVAGAPHVLLGQTEAAEGQAPPRAVPVPPAAAGAAESVKLSGTTPPLPPPLPEGVTSVFVAHGKNRKLLDQVKAVVQFGRFTPVVAEERESPAIPVSDKIIEEMHRCQAAIIIVSADEKVTDAGGKDSFAINNNVLIEIGAATILYRKKVVLLWDKRVTVPSNLHGLYRCEFEGDSLDWDAGMRLQRALTEFRAG
jgi:hypothetical protein